MTTTDPAATTQKSRMRTSVKKLETTIASGAREDIATQFKQAMSQLSKMARKGLVSKGAAARKISRMAARINGKASA
jgi:small subunit ribosomal protein S20